MSEETYTMRDGSEVLDPRLGRLPEFDERSRDFPVRELIIDGRNARSYTWRCQSFIDQGREGSCVGMAWAHEVGARPVENLAASTYAVGWGFYKRAQQIDEWPGEAYSGTSVLAGVKAATERGHYNGYRWAFGLNDLILGVGYTGPAIVGVNWYQGMFNTDANGYIAPTGQVAGGHAILCHGVNIKGEYFKLHNSWGRGWGVGGECKISFASMDRLLREQGEACFPVKRLKAAA